MRFDQANYNDMENQHVNKAFQLASLIRKHVEGTLNDSERQQLDTWLGASATNRNLFEKMTQAGDFDAYEQSFLNVDTIGALERFKSHYPLIGRPNRRLRPRVWLAAAAILVFLSAGLGWFYLMPRQEATQSLASRYGDDIPAGGDRATLTLSDGRVVELNTDKEGVIIGDDLTYNDGTSLVEVSGDSNMQSPIELTLTTPRGGQYQTTLSDGTKVWLNAGSSLKYPLHFSGAQRTVILEGEAYFDVSHNAKQPFIVRVNGTQISVLGTQFNVNAYNELTATLVEGSVKITNASGQQLLKPGEEARIGQNITVHPADIDKVIAWKDGYFYFKSDHIEDIMDQLARWYDVEVKYDGHSFGKRYNGRIRREVNLSKVLDMLTYLSGAQFAVSGRQITVTFN
ncbi:FecR domain-containing protein [Parapedobacter lycopersici]|uniref:FecR family protein n=1 Tax=Parapedobacter lycopersici TaxID=1864939 RepID=UPI003340535F